jgi:hypothetical protein
MTSDIPHAESPLMPVDGISTGSQELETYRVFTAEQDFKYASETFLQVGAILARSACKHSLLTS